MISGQSLLRRKVYGVVFQGIRNKECGYSLLDVFLVEVKGSKGV